MWSNIMVQFVAIKVLLFCCADALVYLGDINTGTNIKTFYSDNTARVRKSLTYIATKYNYSESKTYCQSLGTGYSIALVKSKPELEILKQSSDRFSGTHWIGLVLGSLPDALAWDEVDGVSPIQIDNIEWRNDVDHSNSICGAYYSNQAPYFRALTCSIKNYVICEQVRPLV